MEKNKAIQLLERLQDPEPYEPMLTKDAYDAIQMAIDALSADGDTISRKAAIGVLHEALDRVDQIADVPFGVYQNYRDKMNELPPAQPAPSQVAADIARILENEKDMRVIGQSERIKGHWVNGRCNKCNAHAPFWCMASTYHESNFCPNCGAKMEVTE